MVSQSLDTPPNQPNPLNENGSPSTCSDAPMLASFLDVSIVDNYLLQTYIVPLFVQAIVWFRKSMTDSKAGEHVWNAAANATDGPLSRWVRCLTPLISLWITRGRTPAMRQMGLEFKATPSQANQNWTHSTIQSRLMIYAILQFVLPEVFPWIRELLQRRIRHLLESVASNTTEASQSMLSKPESIARQRQRAVLEQIDRLLDQMHQKVVPMLQLVTLILCWSGILHTSEPSLVVSGLTYQRRSTPTPPPKLHLALAHRRWLMHHFLETVRIVVLPSLILIPRIWKPLLHRFYASMHTSTVQRFRRYLRLLQPKAATQQPNEYDDTTTSTCPVCNSIPSTVAVQADCTCRQIYCYACFYYSIILHSTNTSTTAVVQHIPSTITSTNASYTIPTSQKQVHCWRCHDVIQKATTISGNYNASKK